MKFSDTTKKLIADLRLTALRYKNDHIHTTHFQLIYNRYRQVDDDFKVSISHKKTALAYVRYFCLSDGPTDGSIPLTVKLEQILKQSDLQREITGYTSIEPMHIYLAMLLHDPGNKPYYLDYLKKNNITLNFIQRLKLKWFFSSLEKNKSPNFSPQP